MGSASLLRHLSAVSRSRAPRPSWPLQPLLRPAALPPWPRSGPPSSLPRRFSASPLTHAAGDNKSDQPAKPRSRLAFADTDANEQPMDHAEVLDPLRPPEGKVLSAAEYERLIKRISVVTTKPDLVMYLRRHASDTHSNLSSYLPMGTFLSPKTTLTKPKLIRALVHGVWGVPEPGKEPSATSASSSSAHTAEEDPDPVMTRVRAIPDHVSGSLEIPCTPRDLFFVHGHGETVRSLMLQGGVVIHLDTKEHKIVVKGTGAGIKKTVGQIRALLQYRESEMLVPMPTQTSFRTLTLATNFIKRIMRQCNVYIEERAPAPTPASASALSASPSTLHITATSLVSLAAAKQLVRSVWDMILDSRWHAVSATAVSSTKTLTDQAFAMVPFAEPHWIDSKVLDGVARWTIAPIHRAENKASEHAQSMPSTMLQVPLVVPSALSVPTPPPLSASPASPLNLHHHTVAHYLSHLPTTLPASASLEVTTMRGHLALFTGDDITDGASAPASTSSLFAAPLPGGLSLDDFTGFARMHLPQWTFQPSAPRFTAAAAGDPIVEWRRTPREDAAEQEYNLEVAAREKQAAAIQRKMAKYGGTPPARLVSQVAEPTEVAGAPVRRWRIVYSADMDKQADATGKWPGRKDLVVDVAMPLFTEALPPPAASFGTAAGGSSSRIIVGGDLKMDRLEFRQVAVTVDTMDLDTSQAIRTDVTLIQPAFPELMHFFTTVVLPTTVRSENRLFAPPSFVYEGREFTCKWIGRVARSQTGSLEHLYAQANDGIENAVTRVVRRYSNGGPKEWINEEDRGRAEVTQLLGLDVDRPALS